MNSQQNGSGLGAMNTEAASISRSHNQDHENIVPGGAGSGEAAIAEALAYVTEPFEGFTLPDGYQLTGDGLVGPGDRQIAPVPVSLARAYRDAHGATRAIQVRWLDVLTGEPSAAVIPIRDTRDQSRLMKHAADLPVTSASARAFVAFLQDLVVANAARVPWDLAVEKLGWVEVVDDDATLRYVLGSGSGVTLTAQGEGEQIAAQVSKAGSLDGWAEAVGRLKGQNRAQVPIAAALASTLLRELGVPGFVLDVHGVSTKGKTTLLQAAASIVGNPGVPGGPNSQLIGSWDTTMAGAIDRLAVCSGFPSFLDERSTATSAELPGELSYMVAMGRERTRSSPEKDVQARTFETVLLSTGEGPLEVGDRSGVAARILSMRAPLFEVEGPEAEVLARGLVNDLREHHGHALPAFVHHLQRMDAEELGAMASEVAAWLKGQATSGIGARRAEQAAAVYIAHALAFRWGLLPDRPGAEYLELVAGDAEADDPMLVSLELLVGAAASDPFVGKVRWLDDGRLAIEAGWAKEYLRRHRLAPREHLAAWRDRGWLDAEEGRLTRKARVGIDGRTAQCVVIQPWAPAMDENAETRTA